MRQLQGITIKRRGIIISERDITYYYLREQILLATFVRKKNTCKRIASFIREQRDEYKKRKRDEKTWKVRALAMRGVRREAKLVLILLGLQGVQEQDLRGLDLSQAAY